MYVETRISNEPGMLNDTVQLTEMYYLSYNHSISFNPAKNVSKSVYNNVTLHYILP